MNKFKFKAAVANQGGAMEADTISKHGRSSKSLMSRKNIQFLSTIYALSVMCLVFTGCPKDPEDKSPLTITKPNYGDIYHCGQWVDIFVSGYTEDDWQEFLELEYSCLTGEPQHTVNDEPHTYKNKAYTRREEAWSFTFSPETPSVWEGHWVKLIAHNKKNGVRSDPQYIRITNPLIGVWDRGDIRITFTENSGVITQINSGSWLAFLDKGLIKIGDPKFRNITRTGNLTWSCQELFGRSENDIPISTFWNNLTITLNEARNAFTTDDFNYIKIAE